MRESVNENVVRVHRKETVSEKAGKKKATDKVKGAAKNELKKARGRWWASVKADQLKFIDLWKPASARVVADDPNGCYRVYYPSYPRRSVSWAARGQEKAAMEVLAILWNMEAEVTGNTFPHIDLIEAGLRA